MNELAFESLYLPFSNFLSYFFLQIKKNAFFFKLALAITFEYD